MTSLPSRIVCLTEETVETLYLLGEQDRIVGISGFTVRPPEARRDKPKVSAFTSAKYEKILELEPDLVIGFSDLQADIAADLIRRGVDVLITNQRSVEEILKTMQMVANLVGATDAGQSLIARMNQCLDDARAAAAEWPRRPRVYFEEWDDPMISAIGWVSELIGIAGGEDCFGDLGRHGGAADRIIADGREVVRRDPELIVGSWCGKKFRPEKVAAREGWQNVTAVRNGRLAEIKSPIILQPGPAALTEGLRELQTLIGAVARPL